MSSLELWQRSVLPQGGIARPSTASTEAWGGVGRSVQQFGGELGETALKIARANEILKDKQEKREQADTLVKVLEFSNEGDAALEAQRKNAAPGAEGFNDAALANFDKRSDAFLESVPESQKQYAQAQLARLRGGVQSSATEFEVTTRNAWGKQRVGDALETAAAGLVVEPGKLDFARSSFVNLVKSYGLEPNQEAAALSVADQKLSAAALGGLIQKNPYEGLAQITEGKWGAVGAEKLLSLQNQAEAEIRQRETLARVEANMQQAAAQGDLLGRLDLAIPALQATGVIPTGADGQPIVSGPEEIMAMIPGRRGEVLARQFATAQLEGEDKQSMLTTGLPDDYARLQSMAPQPGQPWTDQDQHRYSIFAQALQAKETALTEDPASWVMGSPTIQQAWATKNSLAQTPGVDPKIVQQATATAVHATMQAQVDAGAAPWQAKPLTKARALGIVGQMKTAGPQGLKALAQEVTSYGPAAVAQVIKAGAPSAFAVMTAIDDPILLDQAAQSVYMTSDQVTGILNSSGISRDRVTKAVQAKLAPLFGTMDGESRALYQNAFTDLAISALGRGAPNESVAADAVTKSVMGRYQFSGRLRIPTDLDAKAVNAGLAQSMSDLLDGKAGIAVQPPPGFDGMGALQEAARQGGLVWFMNETGDGAILATPEGRWIPVVTRTSQDKTAIGRYEVKLKDAARIGTGKSWWGD